MNTTTGRAFVIRPFGSKKNHEGEEIDFDVVHNELIIPALDALGLSGGTTGEFLHQGVIHEDMFREIVSADIVIADISMHNANAFYELGIRHALRDRYTIMIRADKHTDNHVFDLKPERYLRYSLDNPDTCVEQLVAAIKATIKSTTADSPVFRLLPGLSAIDPKKVVVVPSWFADQVEIAENEAETGTLLSFKDQAIGTHWEKEGLRVVAQALSNRNSHQEAADAWEHIRAYSKHDPEANKWLATHYQRLGRLTESEQAAGRYLGIFGISDWDKAEAHSLIASNQKTQWRNTFGSIDDVEERRKIALTSDSLQRSYDSYHRGFECHRSHYYSGLNAVSMLSMQIALADSYFEEWAYLFDSEDKAEHEMTDRLEHLRKLDAATGLAITSSVKNYDDNWARISHADLLLLTSEEPRRVGIAYSRCKNSIRDFNADSVRNQLALYQSLNLFEDNVNAALEVLER